MCVARSSGVRCGPIVGLDVCGVVDSVSCLGRLATGGARDMRTRRRVRTRRKERRREQTNGCFFQHRAY